MIRLNDVVASTLTWNTVFAYFIGSIISSSLHFVISEPLFLESIKS